MAMPTLVGQQNRVAAGKCRRVPTVLDLPSGLQQFVSSSGGGSTRQLLGKKRCGRSFGCRRVAEGAALHRKQAPCATTRKQPLIFFVWTPSQFSSAMCASSSFFTT